MIDENRYREVLDCYGGDPARWPADVRAELLEFEARNQSVEALRREAQALDSMLDAYRPPVFDQSEAIMAALPSSLGERQLDWFVPASPVSLWRPLAAGAVPLLLGLAVGLSSSTEIVASGEAGVWEAQERVLLAPLGPASEGAWYD